MEKHSLQPKGVKRVAKGLLNDNWSRAISVLCLVLMIMSIFMLLNQLVLSLISTAADFEGADKNLIPRTAAELAEYFGSKRIKFDMIISGIMAVFYFLLVSPLNLGVTNWYQSLVIYSNLQVGQIFYFYRTNDLFTNALLFEVARLVRHIIVLAVTLCPAAVCFGTAFNYSLSAASAAQRAAVVPLSVAGIALAVVGIIVYAFIILRWFVAKYLYVGGHGYGVEDCFRYSQKYMKGNIGKVLRIYISCIPMWCLSVFVFTLLFIIPLTNAILAAAAQDIIDENMSN